MALARESLANGQALAKLKTLVELSNRPLADSAS
jgi:hypothetical protein